MIIMSTQTTEKQSTSVNTNVTYNSEERLQTTVDRCNVGSCNAAAWVRAWFGNSELTFCAHHYAKNESTISQQASHVHDERSQLLQNAGWTAM